MRACGSWIGRSLWRCAAPGACETSCCSRSAPPQVRCRRGVCSCLEGTAVAGSALGSLRPHQEKGGIGLDRSDVDSAGRCSYLEILASLRRPELYSERHFTVVEHPEGMRPLRHRLLVFREPGLISQETEDGSVAASYNLFTGMWTHREGSSVTEIRRDDFPAQPLSLWMGTPHLLPIWGGEGSFLHPGSLEVLSSGLHRLFFRDSLSGASAGHADIDVEGLMVASLHFDKTQFEALPMKGGK